MQSRATRRGLRHRRQVRHHQRRRGGLRPEPNNQKVGTHRKFLSTLVLYGQLVFCFTGCRDKQRVDALAEDSRRDGQKTIRQDDGRQRQGRVHRHERVHAVAGQIAERARAHDRTRGASRSRVARTARLL